MLVGLLFAGFSLSASVRAQTVQQVNEAVAITQRNIQHDKYPYIRVSYENLVSEGSPALFRFYEGPQSDQLVAVIISTGFETWANVHTYYFDPQGRIQKVLKVVSGRPDNPPRQALIYNAQGNVIWQNMAEPYWPVSKIKRLYHTIRAAQHAFAAL